MFIEPEDDQARPPSGGQCLLNPETTRPALRQEGNVYRTEDDRAR